jgi:hypothetical protein
VLAGVSITPFDRQGTPGGQPTFEASSSQVFSGLVDYALDHPHRTQRTQTNDHPALGSFCQPRLGNRRSPIDRSAPSPQRRTGHRENEAQWLDTGMF